MNAIFQAIARNSNSPTFKRSLTLILMAEAITILAAWLLLGVNINSWLQERSSQAVRISQTAAGSADWSKIGEVTRGHDSALFENYRNTLKTLSRKLFPQNDGDVYLVFVDGDEEYRIDPFDPVALDYVGRANVWETAAYKSQKTTFNLVPFADNFGTYLGAFTPVVVRDKVVGLVAAEYDSASLADFQGLVSKAFWYSLGPAALLALLVAYALATRFVDPLEVFRRIDETTREVEAEPSGSAAFIEGLSPREIEVTEYVRQGLSNKEIAERLVVTPETVKKHLKNIKDKTGFNKVDLAVHAEAARQRSVPA